MRLTDLYLFQCGHDQLYALSVDRAGCNIPCAPCKGGWVLRGHLKPTELIEQNYAGAIEATTEFGFCLLEQIPAQWVEQQGSS